jgi:recombination protein RecA
MASKKKEQQAENAQSANDDFVQDLIKDLNREHQTRVAWNLATDMSPTHVKRWVSTGSTQLDYAISNRKEGGCPEGRIIEIYGPPSIGKSHIAAQICRSCQKMGGIAVYIDTENAVNPENLSQLGVDVSKRFIYIETGCVEDTFSVIDSIVTKVKASAKDVPVVVIWDSVAATPAKAELEADYDKDSIGLQARQLSKGFRKITQVIGNQNITLVCLNQIRTKIGVMYGDPMTTSGGLALPFHASVRISLTGGKRLEDPKTKELYGIEVNAYLLKNKVAAPFRKVSFQIHFGKGIFEHEELFDALRAYCDDHLIEKNGKLLSISGINAWKELTVTNAKTGEVLVNKKFYKADFGEIMRDPQYKSYIDDIIDTSLTRTYEQIKFDHDTRLPVDPDAYEIPIVEIKE